MASIFDMDDSLPPVEPRPEPPSPRSKHRESLSSYELSNGKRRLSEMVDLAFKTLEDATVHADWPTAIKAAQIILDRSGFGPRTTMDVNTTHVDLTGLSREELAARAIRISEMLRDKENKMINVTPTKKLN